MKVRIDPERCQGHGRCYHLFTEDDEGYGQVIGDGVVLPDMGHPARLAVSN
ncbi:ferredoxin [Nonomuraea basaltis]|nr:ferredoxin [Nonomuraea basaltis]